MKGRGGQEKEEEGRKGEGRGEKERRKRDWEERVGERSPLFTV